MSTHRPTGAEPPDTRGLLLLIKEQWFAGSFMEREVLVALGERPRHEYAAALDAVFAEVHDPAELDRLVQTLTPVGGREHEATLLMAAQRRRAFFGAGGDA